MAHDRFRAVLYGLAVAAVMAVLPACNPAKRQASSYQKSLSSAPAKLTPCGEGKTPGGKPVRMFRVENSLGENLLLVVGDSTLAVTMPDAATLKVGQASAQLMFLADSSGYIVGVGVSSSGLQVEQRLGDSLKHPPMEEGKSVPLLEVVKTNQKGTSLQIPALDTL